MKIRGSAARPRDTREAVRVITLLEKCIVMEESRYTGNFQDGLREVGKYEVLANWVNWKLRTRCNSEDH